MPDDYNKMKSALHALRSNAFNIQSLLRMAKDGTKSKEILEQIAQAIATHYSRVEALEINIPDENKKDHKRIINYFKRIEADWRNGQIADADYAELLNVKLYNHFSAYFQPLLDSHLDDGSMLQFRL